MLFITLAAASELSPRAYEERVELARLEAGDTPFVLSMGPCVTETCPLVLERGDEQHTVARVDRGDRRTWSLGEVEGKGRLVVVDEHQQLVVELLPTEGLTPLPSVLVHSVQGFDHLVDVRELVVAEKGALRSVWTGNPMPRDVGLTSVAILPLPGGTTLVQDYVLPPGIQEEDVSVAVVEGWRWKGRELVQVEDLPVYAAIAGLAGEPPPACLPSVPVLSTDAWPRLRAGLQIRARVSADRSVVDQQVQAWKACVPDAYVKQAR